MACPYELVQTSDIDANIRNYRCCHPFGAWIDAIFPAVVILKPYLQPQQGMQLMQHFIERRCWQPGNKLCLPDLPVKTFYLIR